MIFFLGKRFITNLRSSRTRHLVLQNKQQRTEMLKKAKFSLPKVGVSVVRSPVPLLKRKQEIEVIKIQLPAIKN